MSSPAFFRPLYAINRPIPPDMATRILAGIPRTMASRSPVTVKIMNSRPEISTMASASA